MTARTRHPNTFFHFFIYRFIFFGNSDNVAIHDGTLSVLAPVREPLKKRTQQAEPGFGVGLRLRLLLFLDPHRRLHEEGGGSGRDVEEDGGVGGLAGALRRRREIGKRRSPGIRRGVEGEETSVFAEIGAFGLGFMDDGPAFSELQSRFGRGIFQLRSFVCNVAFQTERLLIFFQKLMQQRPMSHDCG